jgi:flavin reductase (DIM6/NTAB) family NADH-FMN oxidoreductase RutF
MTDSPTVAAVTDFRAVMASFPTGVCVVTTLDAAGTPRGMTCSSVCSVSLDPPTLLVCLRTASPTLAALLGQASFAVNILHHQAQPTAELFASGEQGRFGRIRWQPGPGGVPHLIEDAHAVAVCQVEATRQVGDHTVVFGEVRHITQRHGHRPLLYGLRRYTAWPHS